MVLLEPVTTVDDASAEVPVRDAPAVAWLTVTVYLPAVTPAPTWIAPAPNRPAVVDTASDAAVVMIELLLVTVETVRMPCARAS